MQAPVYNVLIVDDDLMIRESLKDIFTEMYGYRADVAFDSYDGLEKLQTGSFDIIFSDIMMPKMNGLEFLKIVKSMDPTMPVVMITGFPTVDIAISAMKEGASDFITKPFRFNQIKIITEKLARERKLLLENAHLHKELRQKKTIECLNQNLQAKIKDISILYTISEAFSGPQMGEGVDDIYIKIVEMAAEITGSDFSLLMLIDGNKNELIKTATYGLDNQTGEAISLESFQALGFSLKALPLYINHNRQINLSSLAGDSEIAAECCCFAMVPLLIEEEIFGILITGNSGKTGKYGRNDLKLLQNLAKKASLTIENRILYESIFDNLKDTMHSLISAIEARDKYTLTHSIRVTEYSMNIARVLGCTQEEMEILNSAGYLHDIGKIGISDAILLKQSVLSDYEYEMIKQHPSIGENILRPLGFIPLERDIIRYHHEKWDGSGYPDGLCGEEIPLLSRIIAVADSYDAMTTNRPYRVALTHDNALRELEKNKLQFDQRVVNAFLKTFS